MPRRQEQPEVRLQDLRGADSPLSAPSGNGSPATRGGSTGCPRALSRRGFRAALGIWAAAGALLVPARAPAQLDAVLRSLDPAVPRPGTAGRYRLEARDPGGTRTVEFDAWVESIDPGPDGSVFLRFASGDSLAARVEVAPALFRGAGSLADHIRSVFEVAGGDTSTVTSREWSQLPGLDRAPVLGDAQVTDLPPTPFEAGGRAFECRGRRTAESARQEKPLGKATLVQQTTRVTETWTHPDAPLLGLVRAETRTEVDRRLSQPVAGVPASGPRTWEYRIELLGIGPPPRPGTAPRRRR